MTGKTSAFVTSTAELLHNAVILAGAIQDGTVNAAEARRIVARGRVFLPFGYGQNLAFAPAKFVGYKDGSLADYRLLVQHRHGSLARRALSQLLKEEAVEDQALEEELLRYYRQLGISLLDNKRKFWKPLNASAINDVEIFGLGNDDPEYRRRMAGSYVRDQKVRDEVLTRAGGRCEYCGAEGFETRDGRRYLETHHVISLSEEGPDRPANVIALCATDHRRAHFDVEWKKLQTEFLSKIAARAGG